MSTGFPDVVVSDTRTVLIELKVEKLKWVYFRSSQISFFTKMRRTEEQVWIITRARDDRIVLTKSNDLLRLKFTPYKEDYVKYFMEDVMCVSRRWSKPWNWDYINKVLFTDG